MQLTIADLSKIRMKKKAWMLEETWNLSICFTDDMNETTPKWDCKKFRFWLTRIVISFGIDKQDDLANGPNEGTQTNALE